MYLQISPPGRPNLILKLGGYACARPVEWNQYLLEQVRTLYPNYIQDETAEMPSGKRWKENACILEALDQYLFDEYGFSLPENNLFRVFNRDGEGIPPGVIVEVISSLIEPFGFEIDQVLVTDDELRREVGTQEFVFGAQRASALDGRSGICMINIRDGYSHAFFWKNMDARKFQKTQFRMALTVKRAHLWEDTRSPRESIDIYCELLTEYLKYIGPEFEDSVGTLSLNKEISLLRRYMNNQRFRRSKLFRDTLERKLTRICNLLMEMIFSRDRSEEEIIRVVDRLVRRIITEADEQTLTQV
jgi:hypothetical protein